MLNADGWKIIVGLCGAYYAVQHGVFHTCIGHLNIQTL